ncbi:hypothetical protein B0T09DRAFT_366595 [Sordaria sp. MPI-SDFR-AT-0083]|nr:hypothetical protein B0T09DRAFT_366595 [Sordaria sp. MPI-SDFR-AT-0083]
MGDNFDLVSHWDELDRCGTGSTSRSDCERGLFNFNLALYYCSTYPSLLGHRRPWVLVSLGWTSRMMGRYDQAQIYLQQAMDELKHERDDYVYEEFEGDTVASRHSRWTFAWAELAMTMQLMGRLEEAGKAWKEIYEMAKTGWTDFHEGDGTDGHWVGAYSRLECMCRAVGNMGVVSYLLAVEMLESIEGVSDGGEATDGAREEARRLLGIAVENLTERIKLALEIRAGYDDLDDKLWVEEEDELVRKKHQARAWQIIGRYLQELVDAGVDLNCLDERAYNAMNHAVFVGDTRAESILAAGLKSQFGGDEQKVTLVQDRARLRKSYREIFQEKLRPILLHLRPASPHRLRCVYAEALDADADKQRLFDRLKYLPYADFSFGRLPRSSDRLHRPFTPTTDDGKYIIFISYRWINKDPNPQSPDDANNMQYKRMLDAVELFLQNRPEVDKEKLCIWMDFACVDQDNPSAGVAALPMIIAQCNAIKKKYPGYLWYEHVSLPASEIPLSDDYDDGDDDDVEGKRLDTNRQVRRWILRRTFATMVFFMMSRKLSKESDRPMVMFLAAQTQFL